MSAFCPLPDRRRHHAPPKSEMGLVMALLVLLAVGALLHRFVARPLQMLAQAAGRLNDGQLGTHAALQGPVEIAELAQGFNGMAQAIQDAQQALINSEERTLQSMGDGLIATDARARITLISPAAERFTGWTLAQARGRAISDVAVIESAITGLPTEIPAAPIRNTQGGIEGVVLVFQDVTEAYRMRRALADSEQHFRTLAQELGDGWETVGWKACIRTIWRAAFAPMSPPLMPAKPLTWNTACVMPTASTAGFLVHRPQAHQDWLAVLLKTVG